MYTTGGTISEPPAFGHKISMPSRLLSVHVRLTPELKAQLQAEAASNDRSINAEILGRLERSFDPDAVERGRALQLIHRGGADPEGPLAIEPGISSG